VFHVIHKVELTCIPPFIAVVNSSLCFSFPFVPRIDITDEMIPYVVADLKKKQMSAKAKIVKWQIDVHEAQGDDQILIAHNKDPRKPRQSPLGALFL
jgi:hypothetical protein